MRESEEAPALWAVALWAAVLSGILVAWSPRYWAVSVAVTSLSTIVVAWMIASALARRGLFQSPGVNLGRRIWPRQTALVALIGAWGFLQIAFHTTLLPWATLENSIIWALSASTFVMSAQILRGSAARGLFLELLLGSFTVLAFAAMVQYDTRSSSVFGLFPADDNVFGTFLSPNQFAALMEVAAPLALWHALRRNPLIGGLSFAMILAATFTASSRAGVILLFTELIAFLAMLILKRRRETKVVLSAIAALALLVAIAGLIGGTDSIRHRLHDNDPLADRRELLDSTLHMIAKRPWTGYGMGVWRAVYPQFATFDVARLANEAHNDWAQWTSDGGVPFLLLMIALVVWISRPAIRSVWGLGILSVMAHSYVDYPLREPALSFLWFALAGAVSQLESGNSGEKTVISGAQRETVAKVDRLASTDC